MFKAVVFIKRKEGMSMDDFIHYYETKHALLAPKLLPNLKRYVRHYITPCGNGPHAGNPFDVFTEIWFDNESEFNKAMASAAEPQNAAMIAEIEEHLFDRSSIRMMTMIDYESALDNA